MPFLTLEDPRAKVKGSRDPLGVVPVWAGFGRRLVSNLTTVSNSVRGFTTLLLGRYFGERLFEDGRILEEDAVPVFLRMEQICAYVRHVGHGVGDDIRGIERVRRRVAEPGQRVPISHKADGLILSDQKTYGLWGLFTVSARVSGLIGDGPIGVTPRARGFVEDTYLPQLEATEGRLLRLITSGGSLKPSSTDSLFAALRSALPEPVSLGEVDFYAWHLRDAMEVDGESGGRQRRFRELLQAHTDLWEPVDRAELVAVKLAARDEHPDIAAVVDRILVLESLLVPADFLFQHMLVRGDSTINDVAAGILDHWGKSVPHHDPSQFRELLPEIEERSGNEPAAAILRCSGALGEGDYKEAIQALLDWNRVVMAARGSAPWVTRDSRGRIDVRYAGAEHLLPDGNELADYWLHSYFINSLKRITRQLEEAA